MELALRQAVASNWNGSAPTPASLLFSSHVLQLSCSVEHFLLRPNTMLQGTQNSFFPLACSMLQYCLS